MSTETPVIRNFIGLEEIEKILSCSSLTVNTGFGERIELQPGETLPLPLNDIRDVGLSFNLRHDQGGLQQAARAARLLVDDVSLRVVAEGRFLKNREILVSQKLTEIESCLPIAEWRGTRPDAMMDRRHGFEIEVVFVLNKDIDHQPLRPRRLGTILSQVRFGIRSSKLGNGLIPRPLTEEVRGNKFRKETIVLVEPQEGLFEADSLDEAITIYVNEELHADLGTLRTKEKRLIETQLALHAISQLVFLAAAELADREISESDAESAVGRYLISRMSAVHKRSAEGPLELLSRLKSRPWEVAAQLTASTKFVNLAQEFLGTQGDNQ